MTESKHTPGPWKHDPYWALVIGPDKQEIAAIHAAITHDELKKRVRLDTANANARLIAAAPELLEALKDFYVWLQSPALDTSTLAFMQEKASRAIAKAGGNP